MTEPDPSPAPHQPEESGITPAPAARPRLTQRFRYQSEFARRFFSQGEAEGEARGKAEALLAFLDARNVHVPDDIRADIAACTDIDQLDEWIRRAATADKIQDVLD